MKRLILILAALLPAMLLPCHAAAASKELIATYYESFGLDMWHYSGGYWRIGNNGQEKITISDSTMRNYGSLDAYLGSTQSVHFDVNLPDAVRQAISEGETVTWTAAGRGSGGTMLFDASTLEELDFTPTMLSLAFRPKFNLVKGIDFSDFVTGLSNTIPLVDASFGNNIFSMFGNGVSALQSAGCFYMSDPSQIRVPYIHPLMIKNSSGALKPGYSISMGGSVRDSAGYSIGSGTFAAAGACGLHFSFPVVINYYKTVEDPPPPDPGEDPDDPPGPDDPDDPDPPQPPKPPVPTPCAVTAELFLQGTTYEGHPVPASDWSVIEYGDASYSAARAYAQGIATNRFSAPGGSLRKIYTTEAEITYETAGTYFVTLTVTPETGTPGVDVKSVNVLRTPSASATISGAQKQNRRQTLSVRIAQDPNNPVTAVRITIKEPLSGESITVSGSGAPENSAHIKYRSRRDEGSDAYFLRYAVDFLSKFGDDRIFEYSVTAVDSRGRSDSCSGSFLVVRDQPPEAAIGLESSYLREMGSNTAVIDPTDLSTTDGDELERFWYYSTNGTDFSPLRYTDLSFGSAQHISFNKTGVGNFSLKLRVRDVWIEDTLEEYVSEADRLSSEAFASSVVDNVAPVVSLGASHFKTAEILLFTNEEVDVKDIRMKLLARGIDAQVYHEAARPLTEPSPLPSLISTVSAPYGFATMGSSWDGGSVLLDEDGIYQLTATFIHGGDEYEVGPQQPFTLNAYSAADGSLRWQFILTQSILRVSDSSRFTMTQDVNGRYIFLTFGEKTAVVSKKTGRLAGVFSFVPGPCSASSDSSIYAFKEDGIYRLGSTGAFTRIRAESILVSEGSTAMMGGKTLFVCRKNGSLYEGFFDPGNESCEFIPLKATLSDPFTAPSSVVGIDTRGRVVLFTGTGVNRLRVFDAFSGELLASADHSSENNFAVRDPGGRINYVISWSLKESLYVQGYTQFESTHSLTGLYDGYSYSISLENRTSLGQYTYALHAPALAFELYDGSVYMVEQARWKQWRFVNEYDPHYSSKTLKMKSGDGSACGIAAFDEFINWSSPVSRTYEAGRQAPGIFAGTLNNNAADESAASMTDIARLTERESDRRERLARKYFTYEKDYSLIVSDPDLDSLIAAMVPAAEGISVRIGEGGGLAYTTLNLEAGRKYYFEYESSSGAAVSFLSENDCFGNSADGYRVIAIEGENFNSEETNAYFTLNGCAPSDGKLKLASRVSGWGLDYSLYSDSGSLSFTVPEGYAASLSFTDAFTSKFSYSDHWFTLSKDGGSEVRMIDGVDGRFTEKSLLQPGTYTLTGRMRNYSASRNKLAELAIDDLRLCILEKTDSADCSGLSGIPAVQQTAGSRVSGSVTAPRQLSSYGRLDAEYYRGTDCSLSTYSHDVSGGNTSEVFAIPDGRTAVYLGFDLHTNGTASSPSMALRAAKWTWGSRSLQRIPDWMSSSYYASVATNLPEYYTFVGRMLTGTQTLTGRFPGSDGEAAVDDLEAVIAAEGAQIPQTAAEGRFFIDDGSLYYEQTVFTGSVRVSVDADADISGLKIWYMENGSRVYVCRMPEAGLWQTENALVTLYEGESAPEPEDGLIYGKGEYVAYTVSYSDYEDDPSKQSFYRYIHTPLNDGPAFGGETVLLTDSAIHRFYHDGKYVLQHWQTDDTGNPAFDKDSNVVEIVFYIRGFSGAPRIDMIQPDPEAPEPGDEFSIVIAVSDDEGDDLILTVELYLDGEKIWEGSSSVSADPGGNYPLQVFPQPDPAKEGRYDIVAVVRDDTGAGMGTDSFTVGGRPDVFELYRLHRIW